MYIYILQFYCKSLIEQCPGWYKVLANSEGFIRDQNDDAKSDSQNPEILLQMAAKYMSIVLQTAPTGAV